MKKIDWQKCTAEMENAVAEPKPRGLFLGFVSPEMRHAPDASLMFMKGFGDALLLNAVNFSTAHPGLLNSTVSESFRKNYKSLAYVAQPLFFKSHFSKSHALLKNSARKNELYTAFKLGKRFLAERLKSSVHGKSGVDRLQTATQTLCENMQLFDITAPVTLAYQRSQHHHNLDFDS